jgi:hypothetical protein
MGRKGFWQGGYDDDEGYKGKAAELADQSKSASNVAKGAGALTLASFAKMVASKKIPSALLGAYGTFGGSAATAGSALRSTLKQKQADEASKAGDEAVGMPVKERKDGGRAKR